MSADLVYLDNSASTAALPEVVAVVAAAMAEAGNAASAHRRGAELREGIAEARATVAAFLGAVPEQIVFTSGGTEGNNAVLKGGRFARIITSAVEHPSILAPIRRMAEAGAALAVLPVDGRGLIDLDALLGELRAAGPTLVALQWVNGETGIIQPVETIAGLCREHGATLHVDAAQAVGRLPLDLANMAIDSLAFSGHKLHGPHGTGVLFLRRPGLPPLLDGGGQEAGLRSGTLNAPGILGLAEALRRRAAGFDEANRHMAHLRNSFEAAILENVPEVTVNGEGAPRVANTSNLRFAGVDGQALLAQLDRAGVMASQGSACTSLKPEPPAALRAMGLSEEAAFASVRFSFSVLNRAEEAERAAMAVAEAVPRLRAFMQV